MSHADTRGDDLAELEAADDLDVLIDFHEDTNWSDVPGVSTAEAAAWTQRLIEARDSLEGGL